MVEQWFVQLKDQFQAAQMSLGKLICRTTIDIGQKNKKG